MEKSSFVQSETPLHRAGTNQIQSQSHGAGGGKTMAVNIFHPLDVLIH